MTSSSISVQGSDFMEMTRIAVIPAYEPDIKLLSLLPALKDARFTIILVDDGSEETYADIFAQSEPYATVLHHEHNQGKGRALKTGFAYIQENFSTDCVLVTMDADGQHTVEDACKVCDVAAQAPGTLVLGSRKLDDAVPLRSRFGNSITRKVYALTTGVKVYDTQTGLRGFTADLLPKMLEIDGERYEYEMQMLLEFAREKIPIKEVEISTIYINNNATSHFNTIRDSARVYWEILRFSASSLISFAVDYILYTLLSLVTTHFGLSGSLWISNICARLVSATVNYTLNRKMVFHSQTNLLKSALQYAVLAILILAGNTLVLSLLTEIWNWNRYLAKICTELLFFVLNWIVQHTVIFKNKQPKS